MADTKISDLTDGSPLVATDDIPVARAGTNRRVRINLATVATSGAYADLSGTPISALPVAHVNVTGSKTLALSDSEVEQRVNSASAVVLTIPTNAAVAYADNAKIPVMGIGTGTVTITASAGVSINGVSGGSAALSAQYSAAVLTNIGVDTWVLNGAHGAVS